MNRIALVALAAGLSLGACGDDSKPPPKQPQRVVKVPSKGLGGPVDAPGKLPMEVVDEHMDEVRAIIKGCADATTFEGEVAVRVTIEPTGEASAVLEQAANEPEIDDCMTGAFEKVTFPTSERGQRYRYSYTF